MNTLMWQAFSLFCFYSIWLYPNAFSHSSACDKRTISKVTSPRYLQKMTIQLLESFPSHRHAYPICLAVTWSGWEITPTTFWHWLNSRKWERYLVLLKTELKPKMILTNLNKSKYLAGRQSWEKNKYTIWIQNRENGFAPKAKRYHLNL